MPTETTPAEPFQREDRYIVIKRSDMERLPIDQRRNFAGRCRALHDQMFIAGAPARSFLVVESDWPEYEPVWRMIERRMAGQPPVTAAEEHEAVLHWRGKHTQAIRERDALQQRLNAADQRIDELEGQLSRLSAIGELIRSQDNRCTDQPMFAVMEKRSMVTLDTHDHDRIDWVETESGDYGVADDVRASRLEALHQGGRDTPGWERYAMKDIDVFVTACFTEQGCKDFLARDGHNLCKPFIYAFGSYRNGEYQAVRNILKSLPGTSASPESR